MGQTLSHGVYLPAEGERNCYSGLASNWNLLDTAIGDTAGKASATHTHGNITNDGKVGTTANKPLITGTGGVVQAGDFGNQANTFCEGNDSRLSDARTPVAHTHLTADVTDLLNTAHEWTGDNTYTTPVNYKSTHTLGNLPVSVDAQQAFRILDSTGTNFLCDTASFQNTTASGLRFTIRDKFDSDGFSPSGTNRSSYLHFLQNANSQSYLQWDGYTKNNVIPLTTNTYDLGSSSYQWNNLYAKNYYYNGTAWGLDKANVWSANNKFTDNVSIEKNIASPTASSDTSLALTGNSQYIFFRTKGSSNYKSYNSFLWGGYLNGVSPYRYGRIRLYRASAIYGETGEETPDTSFSFIDVALHYKWVSLTDNVRFINDGTTNACEPLTNNATELGTSDNKWKSFNGVNPGALSLPGEYISSVTEYITDKTGGNNIYTAPADGWVGIQASSATFASENFIFMGRTSDGTNYYAQNALSPINSYWSNLYHGCILLPVISGKTYGIRCKCDSVDARFYRANGNVS